MERASGIDDGGTEAERRGHPIDGRPRSRPAEREAVSVGDGHDTRGYECDGDTWTMAALAHASILITLVSAFAGGVGALLGLVIPLVIYLSHRARSRTIAFQALQALVYQGAGVLAYVGLALVLALIVAGLWIIVGLLSAVVVGFLLMPAAVLTTGLMVVVLLLAPLAWLGYGLYAAYQVYQGGHFRYLFIGDWIERRASL
jgi:uncharacterized Tic20 family protein